MNRVSTALIIGGGYLGSRLYRRLLESGTDAVLGDVLPECCSDAAYCVDVADERSVRDLRALLTDEPEIVFMAVSAKGKDGAIYPKAAGNIARFFPSSRVVFCSSTAVYGVTDGSLVDESHPLALNPRTEILHQAERMVMRGGGTVARLSALYGEGRFVLLDRLRDQGIAVSPNPDKWVNYIHREDAVSALLLLASSPETAGRVVNVSDGNAMQLADLYSRICPLLNLPLPRYEQTSSSPRRGHTNQRVSNAFLRSLGWEPCYPSLPDFLHS